MDLAREALNSSKWWNPYFKAFTRVGNLKFLQQIPNSRWQLLLKVAKGLSATLGSNASSCHNPIIALGQAE